MTWLPLLLSDPSPCLRYLVLRELLKRPADDIEVRELDDLRPGDDLVKPLFASQGADGAWQSGDLPGPTPRSDLLATTQVLLKLGYLGFDARHPNVQRAAECLFASQNEDGSFPLPQEGQVTDGRAAGYSMIPLQTSLPLRALALCGYATDPRAEHAYDWLMAQRLPDGAWPTGIASGDYGHVAGYRRLPHSRWGCRANTTGVLACLALHPQRCNSPEAQRALDLLLGRETRETFSLGFEVARLIGAEPARGFTTYYARFDLAQLLDLCWRIGASRQDERVAGLIDFIQHQQGPYGLWEYTPRPQTARWLTFDLLRSLSHIDDTTPWLSLEPRTPFSPYPKKAKRY
jgi:hypothetical protein